jgi:hypothetical protein
MKITKRQLRRIIREETTGVKDATKTSDAFGGGEVGEDHFVDVDEDSLLNQLTDPGVVRDFKTIPEGNSNKITKRQLHRIVKEEKLRLNEGAREMAALLNAIDVMKTRHGQEYIIDVLKSLIDEMETGEYETGGYYQD